MKTTHLHNTLIGMGLTKDEIFVLKAVVFPNLPKTVIETALVVGLNKDQTMKVERAALAKLKAELVTRLKMGGDQ